MRRVSLYMFRQLLWPFLIATGSVAGIIWTFQSVQLLEMVLNEGVSASDIIRLAILNLPKFIGVVLPIILFATVLFVYGRMANENEIAVFFSSGTSPLGIGRAAIALATIVTLLCFAINLYLIPVSYRSLQDLRQEFRRTAQEVVLRPGAFNDLGENVKAYIGGRDGKKAYLEILIYDGRDGHRPVTIMAKRGVLLRDESAPRILLQEGNRHTVDRATGTLRILHFESYTFPLIQKQDGGDGYRWREPKERFLHELLVLSDRGPDAKNDRRFRNELRAEAHYRLASPWLALVFTMIALAAVLGGEFNRTRRSVRKVVAIAVVAAIQAHSLALHGMAARTPALVPLMYAVPASAFALSLWMLSETAARAFRKARRLRRRLPGAAQVLGV